MSVKSDVIVNIISQWKNAGAKSAASDLTKLENTAKKVAVAFGGLFAIEKLAAFSKEAVNAFAAETKQAAIFAQTITGLGFAMQESGIVEYITKTSEATGVMKDTLEPAFASLLRYTRNVAESQKLLALALDISAGTGKGLQEVSNALGRAYLGNYTALVRLGAGITTTDAKMRTFQGNVDYLASAFNGDAMAAANTFGGTIDRLKVSAHEAAVQIGGSLAASVITLGNMGSNFSWIDTLGKKISDLIYNISKFAIVTKDVLSGLNPFNLKNWTGKNNVQGNIDKDIAKLNKNFAASKQQQLGISQQQFKVNTNLAALSSKELATQKQLTAQQQAQLKAKQAQAILTKAQSVLTMVSPVFDLTAIETYAALQQATNDGDRARLQLMQDIAALQRAVAENDSNLAAQIAQSVALDVQNLSIIQGGLNNLKSPDNPLKSLLDDIYASIAALQLLEMEMSKAMRIATGTLYISSTGESSDTTTGTWGQYYKGLSGGLYGSTPVINQTTYNIAGTVVSEQMLSQTLANNNASGIPSNINRLNVNYAY